MPCACRFPQPGAPRPPWRALPAAPVAPRDGRAARRDVRSRACTICVADSLAGTLRYTYIGRYVPLMMAYYSATSPLATCPCLACAVHPTYHPSSHGCCWRCLSLATAQHTLLHAPAGATRTRATRSRRPACPRAPSDVGLPVRLNCASQRLVGSVWCTPRYLDVYLRPGPSSLATLLALVCRSDLSVGPSGRPPRRWGSSEVPMNLCTQTRRMHACRWMDAHASWGIVHGV